jgi:hypothetical protein
MHDIPAFGAPSAVVCGSAVIPASSRQVKLEQMVGAALATARLVGTGSEIATAGFVATYQAG